MRANELKNDNHVDNIETKKSVSELCEQLIDKINRIHRLLDRDLENNNVIGGMIESLALLADDLHTVTLNEHKLLENSIRDFDVDLAKEKLELYISENVDTDIDEGLRQTLRKVDPTIKHRLRKKADDLIKFGDDMDEFWGERGMSERDLVRRESKPSTYYNKSERYRKLADKKHSKPSVNPLPPRTVTEDDSGSKLGDYIRITTGATDDCDFYIVRRGSLESVGKPSKQPLEHGYGIKVLDTDILDPNYLYYMLMYVHSTGYFKKKATGATRLVNIRASDIKDIQIGRKGVVVETSSAGIATAMVPPKDKSKVGTLFGGTYTQNEDTDAEETTKKKSTKGIIRR